MGARLVRGRRPVAAGVGLTPQPWWFGPQELAPPGDEAPFDLVLLDRDGTIIAEPEDHSPEVAEASQLSSEPPEQTVAD